MSKAILKELGAFGQSIWLDNISRFMITSGKIEELIDAGLRGMTSNPTIFDKSISNSNDYDEQIVLLCKEGKTTFEVYDELTVKDIQDALDIFRSVYNKTHMLDGYVSLEVNPQLAYNPDETIQEGLRLFKKVNRPNLMLKVPATEQGFGPIEEFTAAGINVNVTLIFSLEQYINAFNAYLRGIKRFIESGGDVARVHSVASVFVSRIDSVIDKILDEKIETEDDATIKDKLRSLKGKAAVANSQLIYGKYREFIASDEFNQLHAKGANIQRALWGSTSTKNPEYNDIKYVVELIGKDTVNTVPGNTLEAFLDHGEVKEVLTDDTDEAKRVINDLKSFGIDINEVCKMLLDKGVVAFENSFESLLTAIEQKREKLCFK